jgi:hypothetical protein
LQKWWALINQCVYDTVLYFVEGWSREETLQQFKWWECWACWTTYNLFIDPLKKFWNAYYYVQALAFLIEALFGWFRRNSFNICFNLPIRNWYKLTRQHEESWIREKKIIMMFWMSFFSTLGRFYINSEQLKGVDSFRTQTSLLADTLYIFQKFRNNVTLQNDSHL